MQWEPRGNRVCCARGRRFYGAVEGEEKRLEREGLGEGLLVTEGNVLAARMDAGLYQLFMVRGAHCRKDEGSPLVPLLPGLLVLQACCCHVRLYHCTIGTIVCVRPVSYHNASMTLDSLQQASDVSNPRSLAP